MKNLFYIKFQKLANRTVPKVIEIFDRSRIAIEERFYDHSKSIDNIPKSVVSSGKMGVEFFLVRIPIA